MGIAVRWKIAATTLLASASLGCASVPLYEDDFSDEGRGWFSIEDAGDRTFFGNLSGYLADTDPPYDGVSEEFWDRAALFCKGPVERISDRVCVVHPLRNWSPGEILGQCKMDFFRCSGG